LVVKKKKTSIIVRVSNSSTFVESRKFDFLLLILFNPYSCSKCGRFSAVIPLAIKTGNVNFLLWCWARSHNPIKSFLECEVRWLNSFMKILNDNFELY